MAFNFSKLNVFSKADAKTRVFLLLIVIALIAGLIYGLIVYFGGNTTITGGSRVAEAPSETRTPPGGEMSPEFYRAVMQANTQAAQQAQMSGGSAVPTLVNVPGQSQFPDQSCKFLCPGDEAINVSDTINDLVKEGKLTQEDANKLIELAKSDVTPDEYSAALDEMVKQGKLTPEQARQLLERYKKQHGNALVNESAKTMDAMIKAGTLPLDVANQLLTLQKNNATPEEYSAQLDRLVREGKLSPQAAAQLLAQYNQQKMREKAKEGAFGLQQMAKTGQITPTVAQRLTDLQNKNIPVDEYAAELNRLVAEGKMTPEAAAKLLEQYKKQRGGGAATGALNALVAQEEANAAATLSDAVKNGKISQQDANQLAALQQKQVSPEDYQNALSKLVAEGKLPPEEAKKLMASYQKLAGVRAEAQRLASLQGNNASIADYTNELKRAVQAGLISPQAAAALLAQYRAAKSPGTVVGAGVLPEVDTNIPGASDFSQLQQRVQQQETQAPAAALSAGEAAQFAAASAQAAAEAEQARKQRIDKIQASMSAQAQSLISAWAPPTMSHMAGAPEEKPAADKTAGGKTAEGSTASTKAPLIKAGTILFGVLDTTVDSDYPETPVMVTIVDGKFKGAKLMGVLASAHGKDKLSLNFTMMDTEAWQTTKKVTAFAIDPDTARTVMASSVDYHYLSRYGAMFAYSFLSGYASAISQSGSTSTPGIFGTTKTNPKLSPKDKLAIGLGKIGDNMASQVATYMNTPPTVKVNAGVGLGILFMADVTE